MLLTGPHTVQHVLGSSLLGGGSGDARGPDVWVRGRVTAFTQPFPGCWLVPRSLSVHFNIALGRTGVLTLRDEKRDINSSAAPHSQT